MDWRAWGSGLDPSPCDGAQITRKQEPSDGSLVPATIARWEAQGGTWRIGKVTNSTAVVHLIECTGGQVMETLEVSEPGFLAWARLHQ